MNSALGLDYEIRDLLMTPTQNRTKHNTRGRIQGSRWVISMTSMSRWVSVAHYSNASRQS